MAIETRQFEDQDGHVFTVSWARLNHQSYPESAEYNVWVSEDGEEIDFTPQVDAEYVKEVIRDYRRRCSRKR